MKNKRKNKLTCQLGVVASDFLFSGGFYSDNLAFVAKGCKKCPNGSYVAYDKKPGKSVLDCKTCPLGKQAPITYLYIEEMPYGRIYSRHIPNQVIYGLLTQRVRLQKIFQQLFRDLRPLFSRKIESFQTRIREYNLKPCMGKYIISLFRSTAKFSEHPLPIRQRFSSQTIEALAFPSNAYRCPLEPLAQLL